MPGGGGRGPLGPCFCPFPRPCPVDLLLRHGAAVPAGPVIRDGTPFASHFQAYAKLRFEATLELTELATPQDLDFVRAALGTALAPAEFSRLRTLALASRSVTTAGLDPNTAEDCVVS